MTSHAARSSGFSTFFFGALVALVVAGGAIMWFGARDTVVRTAELTQSFAVPTPSLPPPPGVIPNSGAAPASSN